MIRNDLKKIYFYILLDFWAKRKIQVPFDHPIPLKASLDPGGARQPFNHVLQDN